MFVYSTLFYLFSVLLISSAVGAIAFKNTVYSVLCLIFSFFNGAAIALLLGAEFIAMSLVIVYVGAVAVLFLFIVMTIDFKSEELKEHVAANYKILLVIGLLFLSEIIAAIYLSTSGQLHISDAQNPIILAGTTTNTRDIGLVLYTKYFYLFQLCGFILLASIISAITLTHRNSKNSKKQIVNKQIQRNKNNSIRVVSVKKGEGTGRHAF